MKRSELVFNLVSIPIDISALALAGLFSFYIRVHAVELVGPIIFDLHLSDFIIVLIKVIPVVLIIFSLAGLYNLKGTSRIIRDIYLVCVSISLAALLTIVVFFFNQSLFPSRFIILAAWGFAIIFVCFARIALKLIQRWLFAKGYGLHRLVLINGQGIESDLIQNMLKNPAHGYKIVSELENNDNILNNLEKLIKDEKVDEIMQANPKATDDQNFKLVSFARNRGIRFSFIPNLFDVQKNVIELSSFRGIPLISLKNSPLDGWGKVTKRIFDIITSLICIIITSPVFVIIAIAIKLDSRGPILYRAKRGSRNKDFLFLKFRSMYTHLSVGEQYGGTDAEKLWLELRKQNDRGGVDGPVSKFKKDPRVTKVGRILRRTKLDEIPQFFNVLKGDISMVGPRPHILPELESYKDKYPRILSIKPGVFGPAQLAIITWPVFPFEEEMRVNMYYIENWSIWLDITILAKSFYHLVTGKRTKEDY